MGEENILTPAEQLAMIRSIEHSRLSGLTLTEEIARLERRVHELEIEVQNFSSIRKSILFVLSIAGGGSGLLTLLYWIVTNAK